MTDNACIWVVQGHEDVRNLRGWRSFASPTPDDVPEAEVAFVRRNKSGEFLPREAFPEDSYAGWDEHKERVPQIFHSGFYYVRAESAAVLRQFDLRRGALYPTRLWHPGRTTPVPVEVFYLSQGNKKNAFLLDRSPLAYRFPNAKWTLPPNPVDDQLVFSEAGLQGPDIWWDVSIARFYFISDRLARALRDAGVDEDWMLLRCPVVGAE